MPSLFLLINTVKLTQSTPNSFYPLYQLALSRSLLRFCGTTFVKTIVFRLDGVIQASQNDNQANWIDIEANGLAQITLFRISI